MELTLRIIGLIMFYFCTIGSIDTISTELILTPMIKQGKVDEARNASRVNPDLFLNITSHSGFLTVDNEHNSNMFFWYFPIMNKYANDTPWIIWLQGGPGASSIAGLFDEMGPFKYDDELKLNQWSWTKEYSMLFLDNPVGAGYSYTDNGGYVTSIDQCAEHLYNAIQQFLTVFPELREAPLYIAGESYAGLYVPAFATKIVNAKVKPGEGDPKKSINLKGIALGNPVLDRQDNVDYSSVFYQFGLIDSQGVIAAKPLQDAYAKAIQDNDYKKAYQLRDDLLTKLQDMPFQQQTYNLLKDTLELNNFESFLRSPVVSEAIHVGYRKFTFSSSEAAVKLIPEFLLKGSLKVQSLLNNNYKVMIYCGQLDLTTPCGLNARPRRKSWQWNHHKEFLKAPRTPWWFNETVAGYVKRGGGLTEVLVREAGHLVPLDKPAQSQQLMSYFIRGLDLPLPINYKPNPENTPEYVEPDTDKEHNDADTVKVSNSGASLIVSIFFNVVALIVIILGVLYFLRWKRRYTNEFYADSAEDGILSIS